MTDGPPDVGVGVGVGVGPRKPDVLALQVAVEAWHALQAQAEAPHAQAQARRAQGDAPQPAA